MFGLFVVVNAAIKSHRALGHYVSYVTHILKELSMLFTAYIFKAMLTGIKVEYK